MINTKGDEAPSKLFERQAEMMSKKASMQMTTSSTNTSSEALTPLLATEVMAINRGSDRCELR